MDAIRSKKLCRQFPLFLRGRNHSIRQNLMAFGFECGPGWYRLLQSAFEVAERECREQLRRGVKLENLPIAVQVKEKFGTLRLYAHNCPAHVYDAIEAAENESAGVCEQCGKPASASSAGGWITTMCDACKSKRKADAEQEHARSVKQAAKIAGLANALAATYVTASHSLNKQQRAAALELVFTSYASKPQEIVTHAMQVHERGDALRDAKALLRRIRRKHGSLYYVKKLLQALLAPPKI